jgi:hypothetical protein
MPQDIGMAEHGRDRPPALTTIADVSRGAAAQWQAYAAFDPRQSPKLTRNRERRWRWPTTGGLSAARRPDAPPLGHASRRSHRSLSSRQENLDRTPIEDAWRA